jgi:hypothetical protein
MNGKELLRHYEQYEEEIEQDFEEYWYELNSTVSPIDRPNYDKEELFWEFVAEHKWNTDAAAYDHYQELLIEGSGPLTLREQQEQAKRFK